MPHPPDWFHRLDTALTEGMARYGVLTLRLSLGVIFFWFGVLKFFPGVSSAELLAAETITRLTFGFIPGETAMPLLAAWEVAIGLGLLSGFALRVTLFLLWTQMLGTVTPLFFFPERCFTIVPLVPTFEGQYIIKNLVLVSAGLVIGATVRGGRLSASRV